MGIEDALGFESITLTVDKQKFMEEMPGSNDILWQIRRLIHPMLTNLRHKDNLSFEIIEDVDLFAQNKVRLVIQSEET